MLASQKLWKTFTLPSASRHGHRRTPESGFVASRFPFLSFFSFFFFSFSFFFFSFTACARRLRGRPRKLKSHHWKRIKLKSSCFSHNGCVSVPLLRTTSLAGRFSAVPRGVSSRTRDNAGRLGFFSRDARHDWCTGEDSEVEAGVFRRWTTALQTLWIKNIRNRTRGISLERYIETIFNVRR